jgi:polar amino acid transport system ATP-binding protein
MRCINLLEELSDGQVLLEGADISEYGIDLDSVRGKIGSVFQAFNLFPHLTVLENITLAPRLVLKKSKEDAAAYTALLQKRLSEQKEARRSEISKRRSSRKASKKE